MKPSVFDSAVNFTVCGWSPLAFALFAVTVLVAIPVAIVGPLVPVRAFREMV